MLVSVSMRVQLTVSPVNKCSIESDFEYKFRGVVYSNLEPNIAQKVHDERFAPFTFSGVFPFSKQVEPSDEKNIIVSSYRSDVIHSFAENVSDDVIEVGDVKLEVIDVDIFSQEIPLTGKLYTPSGVYCEIDDDSYNTATYWKEEYGVDSFIEEIEQQLDNQIDKLTEYNSADRDFAVFSRASCEREFSRQIQVDTNEQHTVVLSKWNLSYTITNDLHYEYIKLAYQLGIGGKNTLGCGYCFLK